MLSDLINKYENELAEKDRKIDLLLVVLGSADFIRGIRNKLQLQLGANDQINSVIATSGAMKTVEGTTYYMVPKKLPIINKDGSEGTITLLTITLLSDGVNAIAFKFSKKYNPLILRKKEPYSVKSWCCCVRYWYG